MAKFSVVCPVQSLAIIMFTPTFKLPFRNARATTRRNSLFATPRSRYHPGSGCGTPKLVIRLPIVSKMSFTPEGGARHKFRYELMKGSHSFNGLAFVAVCLRSV